MCTLPCQLACQPATGFWPKLHVLAITDNRGFMQRPQSALPEPRASREALPIRTPHWPSPWTCEHWEVMFHNEVFKKWVHFRKLQWLKETLLCKYVWNLSFVLHINDSLHFSRPLQTLEDPTVLTADPLPSAPHCHSLMAVSKLQLVQNKTNPHFSHHRRITHPSQPPLLCTWAPHCHRHCSWSPARTLVPSTQRQRKVADSFWSRLPAMYHPLPERYIPCLISDLQPNCEIYQFPTCWKFKFISVEQLLRKRTWRIKTCIPSAFQTFNECEF